MHTHRVGCEVDVRMGIASQVTVPPPAAMLCGHAYKHHFSAGDCMQKARGLPSILIATRRTHKARMLPLAWRGYINPDRAVGTRPQTDITSEGYYRVRTATEVSPRRMPLVD